MIMEISSRFTRLKTIDAECLKQRKGTETMQTSTAVADPGTADPTVEGARYMDHEHDHPIAGAHKFSNGALFAVEQDDSNKPLSATNFHVGVSQIIPARLIPIYTARKPIHTRQKARISASGPSHYGRKPASMRQKVHICLAGSPHQRDRKSEIAWQKGHIHVARVRIRAAERSQSCSRTLVHIRHFNQFGREPQ